MLLGGPRRSSRRHALVLSQLSRAAAVSVALLGLVVLVGWALDVAVLKSALPRLVAMKANTAVGLFLLGVSIGLRTAPCGPRLRLARRAAAMLAALIGATTLAEYMTGWDAGIDQLLFRDLQLDPRAPVPGRMAAATAIDLMLLGSGIVLLDARRRGRMIGEGLVLVAGWFGGLASVGYALGAEVFYTSIAFSAMALHTSFALAVGAAAALGSEPTVGLARVLVLESAGGRSARQLMPLALLTPVAVAVLVHLGGTRGLYQPELELAIASVVSAVSLSALVWATATRLDDSETLRRHAETESLTDPLTGLANRRALDSAFAGQRPGLGLTRPYSVVVADLDDLKRINDLRGHIAGDEALRRVASVFRMVTRPADVVARVGGDEFVALLPEADAADARRVAARMARLLGEQGREGAVSPFTVAMGTATWAPGDDAAAVLARADVAMYDEKHAKDRTATVAR